MKWASSAGFILRLLTIFLSLAIVAGASAQSGDVSASLSDSYDLSWNTVDGGGYTFSTGSGYSLGGTIGQPDAGALTGGRYTLGGGFWGGGVVRYGIYLPLVLRNYP